MIGYWTPADEPARENTLVFILAYPSREARDEVVEGVRERPGVEEGQGRLGEGRHRWSAKVEPGVHEPDGLLAA